MSHRIGYETVKLHGMLHTSLGYLPSEFHMMSAAYFIGSWFMLIMQHVITSLLKVLGRPKIRAFS